MSETPNPMTGESLTEREIAKMSPEDQIRYAIVNGCHRANQIDEVTNVSLGWTKDTLDDMVAAGAVEKRQTEDAVCFDLPEAETPDVIEDDATRKPSIDKRDGDDTVEAMEAEEEDVKEAASEHGGEIPVDRDYDWEREKLDPDSVANYVDSNGEYADMLAEIEAREVVDKLPRFRVTGPTGCGKTTAGEALALELDAPCFIVECHDGLRPNNLLGMPTYVGDETWFVDGPVTKALLASDAANDPTTDFDEVFLIFDEVNRTTARTLGVVMSALDHRGEVTLNARGGETVSGDPMNLVTVATMNEGDGYITNPIDRAQKRRFGNTYPVDYIGVNDTEAEVELLTEKTPIYKNVAREMVRAANEIRKKADENESPVEMGVPTSNMLDWAKTAYVHRNRSADGGPAMKAARNTIVDTFYTENERERDVVVQTLETHVRGMDVSEKSEDIDDSEDESDESDEGLGELSSDDEDDETPSDDDEAYDPEIDVSEDTFLVCDECGFYEKSEAVDKEVTMSMTCPECSSGLDPME